MSVKLALLLIGAVIVIIVAIGAMDQARLSDRRRKGRKHPADLAHDDIGGSLNIAIEDEGEVAPMALEKRSLKTDEVPVLTQRAPQRAQAFYDEIERIERAIDVRLDVDPDIDRRFDLDDAAVEVSDIHPSHADEHIDFYVTLPGKNALSRHDVLGFYRQHEFELEKPHAIYGLRHLTGVWSNLETDPVDMEYRDIRLAIQLADSAGPISESEINVFQQIALSFADALKRRTLFSMDFEDALALAQTLDQFCRDHDVIASVHVLANDPDGFKGRALDSALTALGLHFGRMNIYHHQTDRGDIDFSVANLYKPGVFDRGALDRFTTQGVTLFEQIPCAVEPVESFSAMVEIGKQLAERLGGRLVDQDRRPLTDSGAEAILGQIEAIAQAMHRRGLPAGGEAARRLFGA